MKILEKLRTAFNRNEEIEKYKQEINVAAFKTRQAGKETIKTMHEFNRTLDKCQAHVIAVAMGVIKHDK